MTNRYFFLLVSLLLLSTCKKGKDTEEAMPIRPVQVVKAEALGSVDKIYTGVVQAEEFSILAFKVAGTLTELNVEEGQTIPKGYLIAQLDNENYRLQYQTALTNYETARSIYERTRRLLAQDATAVQNLEIARADYIQAASAVGIAKSTLAYTRLIAPFQGFIEKKYAENYQQVLVGEAIVKLVNPDKIDIRFTLPETSIGLLEAPKTIYVQFDTRTDQWFEAKIKEYVFSSEGSGIPVTLKIIDPDFEPYKNDIYPGFSCKILFKIENTVSDKFIVPASALVQENGKDYIWLIHPESLTAYRHPVKALRFENQALIQEGLNSNDIIVTAGAQDLKEGQRVTLTSYKY